MRSTKRSLLEGDSSTYLDVTQDACKSSNLLHIELSADNKTLSLTYDIILKDDSSAKDLTSRIGEIEDLSEVVLIASKNEVDY